MNRSVCFTGHRTIAEDIETLSARLYALLERFVTEQKITDFYTGGAVGWDALAALTVLKLRESYPEVKLHLVFRSPMECFLLIVSGLIFVQLMYLLLHLRSNTQGLSRSFR